MSNKESDQAQIRKNGKGVQAKGSDRRMRVRPKPKTKTEGPEGIIKLNEQDIKKI